MKKANLFLLAANVLLGFSFFVYHKPAQSVHAQISTPQLTCIQGFTCGQYVVQVTTQRGFGRWQIFQVDTQSHLIDTTQIPQVAAGNPATSVQFFEPAPGSTQTGTITAVQP